MNTFAVPAFNISDYAMFNGIIDISEEKNAPVIVGIHPDEVEHVGVEMITAVSNELTVRSVPIAIHWDTGDYKQILIAIQSGFTSVMIDGSMLPFEKTLPSPGGLTDSARCWALGGGRAGHDRPDR